MISFLHPSDQVVNPVPMRDWASATALLWLPATNLSTVEFDMAAHFAKWIELQYGGTPNHSSSLLFLLSKKPHYGGLHLLVSWLCFLRRMRTRLSQRQQIGGMEPAAYGAFGWTATMKDFDVLNQNNWLVAVSENLSNEITINGPSYRDSKRLEYRGRIRARPV